MLRLADNIDFCQKYCFLVPKLLNCMSFIVRHLGFFWNYNITMATFMPFQCDTIQDVQLRKTRTLCTQPRHSGIIMQPLHVSMHSAKQNENIQAAGCVPGTIGFCSWTSFMVLECLKMQLGMLSLRIFFIWAMMIFPFNEIYKSVKLEFCGPNLAISRWFLRPGAQNSKFQARNTAGPLTQGP